MNKYHDGMMKPGKAPSPASNQGKGGKKSAPMPMKPGFPSAQLPGAAQKRSRDNGVKHHCKVYADSKGI